MAGDNYIPRPGEANQASSDALLAGLKKQALSDTVSDARAKLQQQTNGGKGILGLLGFAAGTSEVPRVGPIDALADKTPPWQPQPGPTSAYALPVAPDSPPDTGAGVVPGQGGLGDMIGRAAAWAVNAPGSGGVIAPKAATATDVATAPAPEVAAPAAPASAAATLHQAGHVTDTHATGETHPNTHTLEHFVQQNRHLTPRDLQVLQAFLPPQLAPHDQILHDVHQGYQGMRDKALAEAEAGLQSGTLTPAQAAAAKAKAATDYIDKITPFAATPYAQYGALDEFAKRQAAVGGMPPAR